MVTIFTYLKNPESCLSDFLRPYSNESENKKFLTEPMLVKKKYITHMKALILSYFESEGQGRGKPMGAPHPHPFKNFISFLSEGVEAM